MGFVLLACCSWALSLNRQGSLGHRLHGLSSRPPSPPPPPPRPQYRDVEGEVVAFPPPVLPFLMHSFSPVQLAPFLASQRSSHLLALLILICPSRPPPSLLLPPSPTYLSRKAFLVCRALSTAAQLLRPSRLASRRVLRVLWAPQSSPEANFKLSASFYSQLGSLSSAAVSFAPCCLRADNQSCRQGAVDCENVRKPQAVVGSRRSENPSEGDVVCRRGPAIVYIHFVF
jgi:hypothetical protein